jgi:pyruvate decarboxylase
VISTGLSPNSANPDSNVGSIVKLIVQRLSDARHPIIIMDACGGRFGVKFVVREIVEKHQIPCFATPSKLNIALL